MRECSVLLHNIVLQVDTHDTWRWLLDTSSSYIARGAYTFLITTGAPVISQDVDVWQKQIPTKVSLFAWRLFRNRLPTKDNLWHRRVIYSENAVCASGCGFQETTNHLFLECTFFSSLWYQICHWLGISSVFPSRLCQHYYQFTNMAGLPRVTHLFSLSIYLIKF